jgi:hypothetical protein
MVGTAFVKARRVYQRKTYKWTASGAQGDRELCSQQATPGGTWYLTGRDFQPAPASPYATVTGTTIYGIYHETYEDETTREYWDGSAWQTIS